MVFCSYPSKLWNSGPISISIGIVILSFQTLEFLSYPSNQWNSSPICLIVRILILSFQILVFWYWYFLTIAILNFFLQTLEFWSYIYTHWICHVILQNGGILALYL